MAATVVPLAAPATPVDLWGKALQGVTIKHTLDLSKTDRRTTLQDILGLVLAAEEQCKEKRWKWKNRNGEHIILRDVFTKMTVWIDKLKGVGDVIVQYDPGHAALPWAAVRFILQAAINDIQNNAAILEGLELVMNLIAKYETIEMLYLRSPSSAKLALEDNILKLYITILNYLLRAHRHFSQKTITRIAKSVIQLESTTAEFLSNVRIASSNVNQYLPLISEELQQKTRDSVAELNTTLSNLNFSDLVATAKSYDTPIIRMCTQLSAIEDNLRTEERVKIFDWLTTDEYQSHHRSKYKSLLPGSGEWLLKKSEFIEWQGASSSSILWLHGIPGSGKSMLLAHVIEHLKEIGSKIENPAPIAFFYCARNANEPERADPSHLMRTVLEQLCSLDEDTPIREPVVKAYKERKKESRGRAPSPLTLDDAVPLILELLQSNPAIIVIDGLDECDPALRQDLLDALTTIINESSSIIKVLVSSRDDQDLVHHLSQMPNIYIRAAENTGDILSFVETRLNDAILRKKILRGDVSDDLKKEIIRILIEKAKGMFRLASLHIETLCDPSRIKTRSNVLGLLATLPQDLKHSYDMVLDNIWRSQEPNPAIADRIIKWLLCARSPLRAKTFLLAVSSDDEDGEQCSKSEVLDICNNLVIFDEETKRFRFVHLSVQEHLLQLEKYSIMNCSAQLAKQSLTWLQCPHPLRRNSSTISEDFNQTPKGHSNQGINFSTDTRSARDLTSHIDRHWAAYVRNSGSIRRKEPLSKLLFDFMRPDKYWSDLGKGFSMWVQRQIHMGTGFPLLEYYLDKLDLPANPLAVAVVCDFDEIVAYILSNPNSFTEEINPYDYEGSYIPRCAQIAIECNSFRVLQYLVDESYQFTRQQEHSTTNLDLANFPDTRSRNYLYHYRCSKRRKGVTIFLRDFFIGTNSAIQDYWYNVLDTIIFQSRSQESDRALTIVLDLLGRILATPRYIQYLVTYPDYREEDIGYIFPFLFLHNERLVVPDGMLFACCDKNSYPPDYKKKTEHIRLLLIYNGDVNISMRLLELSFVHQDWKFHVIHEMISWKPDVMKVGVTFDPGVVDVLMHYGDLSMLKALKSHSELDIQNRIISASPRSIISTLPFSHKTDKTDNTIRTHINLVENALPLISKGKYLKQLEITWREVSAVMAASEGMGMLQFVLEAQPKTTPAAIKIILAECNTEVVKTLLTYQSIEITDQIVKCAARNIKHGEAIMGLLLDAENERDVG